MTELLYLSDTYLFQAQANILETSSDEFGDYVVLDQTIFYPQGGGQPADNGSINADNFSFKVSHVVLTPESEVRHYGESSGDLVEGEVNLSVDESRRVHNAKLHSAGHLLDCAVAELGLKIKPTKGFHFPVGTYVEYEGVLEDGNQYKGPLEVIINRMVEDDIPIVVKDLDSKEAEKEGIKAPEGKSARFVEFAGHVGCGCGGTHIDSSKGLGKIVVRKLKSKKGNTKISYALEDYPI